jgi:NodT family efflux transporter outer membrane factor (OMF) lipoprotein
MRNRRLIPLLFLACSACTVGPNYQRPDVEVPDKYKEAGEWKVAQPQDASPRGNWWETFNDPVLNELEAQVATANQDVRQAEANYRAAQALVAQARAGFYPTLSASLGATRAGGQVSNATTANAGTGTATQQLFTLNADWEPDLWGRVRRTVESNEASAQASDADLASTRLSSQATLAQDYFQLRVADAEKRLLDETVAAYERSLTLTTNQYNAGIVSKADVAQAQAQLKGAQAQAIDIEVTRQQLEHAIALLVGKAPSTFSIAPVSVALVMPNIPLSMPSALLERRPDIAGAERRMAAANAQIGVAEAAYYPTLDLTAALRTGGTSFGNLFNLSTRVWSVGATATELIFDAGRRQAVTRQAEANFDATVAMYRKTVLGAFQEVEDNLVAIRVLEQEATVQDDAVKASEESVRLALNQYRAGIVSYLNVVTAQTTALTNERSALTIQQRRMVAAATLVKALGGGWNVQEMQAAR